MRKKLAAWWKARKPRQKALVIAGAVVVGVPILGMLYLRFWYPDYRDADPGLDVDRTPPAISRGEYLFHAVADCADCHTRRDFTKLGGPQVGDVGAGFGDVENESLPLPLLELPGEIYPSNITMDRETGLGAWRDDEIIRAIRDGVDRHERPLFPVMRYGDFRFMSDTDVQAIVAYMRYIPSIARSVPRSDIDFPANLFYRTAPQPVTGEVPDINRQDRLPYGEYLATLAGCIECHTQGDGADRPEDMLLAGGRVFSTDSWLVVSANITPHPQTGLRKTEQEFVDLFKRHERMARGYEEIPDGRSRNTIMPWLALSGTSDSDLRTIYAYLRSVPPIANDVNTRPGQPAE